MADPQHDIEELHRFSPHIEEKLGNYVYRLVDPRNGETFYVGMGRGSRVFSHEDEVARREEDAADSEKMKRIREIQSENRRVECIIHRHDIPDDAVRHVEAALIDAYSGLTNIQAGYRSGDVGPMSVEDVRRKMALPAFPEKPEHKLILINVNSIEDRSKVDHVKRQVRGNWVVKCQRAEAADYVVAVYRGQAIAVFKSSGWRASQDCPGRCEFDAEAVDEDSCGNVWDTYVGEYGKRITNPELKHGQNPIRYWNV